jgi:DNA-3-methyladenine glycosylase I
MADPGIVRNRLKIAGAVRNARAYLELGRPFGEYVWSFVDGLPIVNRPAALGEIPAKSAISDALSKDLQKRGFTFVGSTSLYAFMQSVGMVDDHVVGCFRK